MNRLTCCLTLTLGLNAGLLAGCSASSDAAPPAPSTVPARSSSFTADAIPPPPEIAPPLSERAAHALSIDRMQRFNDAILGRYPGPPHATVDDTFIVVSGEPSAPLDVAVARTTELVDTLWTGPYFAHRPEKSVIVWIASSAQTLSALVREHAPGIRDTGLGMYDPQSRQVFVAVGPAGWQTGNHELLHPCLRADFPLAPAWLVEGLPALFESVAIHDGAFTFGAHFRLQTVRMALASKTAADEVKLDTLFTWTSDTAFREHEALHYGVAREALRWLASRNLLWPWYRQFRDGVLDDPSGVRAFEVVTDQTPAEATEAWRAWLGSAEAEGMVPQSGKEGTP
jgi:hypothetical protein